MAPVTEQSPSREIEEVPDEPIQILDSSGETEERARAGKEIAWPFFI